MSAPPCHIPCEFAAGRRAGWMAGRQQCRRVPTCGRGLRPMPGTCPRPHPRPDCARRAYLSALGAARLRHRRRRSRAGRLGLRDHLCRLRPLPPPLRCAAFDAPPSMLPPIACKGRLVRPIKRMPHACGRTLCMHGPALGHGRGLHGLRSRRRRGSRRRRLGRMRRSDRGCPPSCSAPRRHRRPPSPVTDLPQTSFGHPFYGGGRAGTQWQYAVL